MDLHIISERDVGLFSLIQQMIANIPWAFQEGRIPIVYFRDKTCYWTPHGYHERETVEHTFVSGHFGDHPALLGKTLSIPYLLDDPDEGLRREAHDLIRRFVRPRDYLQQKASHFFQQHMSGHPVIGVHARGTDAISPQEMRPYRQGSLVLSKYVTAIQHLLNAQPTAKIFVATDAQSSLEYFRHAFGTRVFAYPSLRHASGEAAGTGPTGWIMPAYIAGARDRAARNGEEAVIEYLLLS